MTAAARIDPGATQPRGAFFLSTLAIAILVPAIASAERFEVGELAGGGAFTPSSGEAAGLGMAGLEGCIFCSGRFGMFAEYSHWFSGDSTRSIVFPDRVQSADLAGAGLRIQGGQRLRTFFDAGLAGGRDEHSTGRGGGIGGVVVGGGIRIPWGEHWYIRPQVRAYGLSPHSIEGEGPHWALSGGAGIGWRF